MNNYPSQPISACVHKRFVYYLCDSTQAGIGDVLISKIHCRQAKLSSVQGVLGLGLVLVAWPASWLNVDPLREYSFFPLWLGYILIVDALVLRRTSSSILTRSPRTFCSLFLLSIPLWWFFEGANYFTRNWHYIGAEEYSTLRYILVASWHFSIVVPAIFETAELVGSFHFLNRLRTGPCLTASRGLLITTVALGTASLFALVLWPKYTFSLAWISLLLVLDPINYAKRPAKYP